MTHRPISPNATRPQIFAIGEVLWDVFQTGARFGGAPANFACTAAALGQSSADVALISAVGQDALGQDALQELATHGVQTEYVQIRERPTGRVDVLLDANGVASYEFASDCAWDRLQWQSDLLDAAYSADVVCFGSLGQRSTLAKQTIQQFVDSTPAQALRVLDVNLRQPFVDPTTILSSLELATVLKLNDDELPQLALWLEIPAPTAPQDVIDTLHRLAERFQLQTVALTRGSEGAIVVRGNEVSEHPGCPTNVVDTVGAGDAFTASMIFGLLNNKELGTITQQACQLAAYVCSQSGATPMLPAEFQNR